MRRARAVSPTARTLAALRSRGAIACKVEQRVPGLWPPVARDAFGFGDILAAFPSTSISSPPLPGRIVLVQATSMSNAGSRVAKICGEECWPAARKWLASGGEIEVWSWRKLRVSRGSAAVRWTPDVRAVRLDEEGNPRVVSEA